MINDGRFKFAFDRTVAGTVLTGLAGQATLVVSGVIVARALGPHGRGELALLVSIAVASAYIASLGVPTAVAFAAARDRASAGAALRSLRGVIVAQALALIALPALAVLLARRDSSDAELALICVPAGAIGLLTVMYGVSVLQGLRRFTAFNLLRLAPPAGYAAGALVLVAIHVETVAAFLTAWAATNVLAGIVLVVVAGRALSAGGGTPPSRRELIAYGLKAQIGTAAPLENFQIDQLLVGSIAGPAALGFYVIGSAFTNLPRFIAQSLGMVAFPRVAERLGIGGARAVAGQAVAAAVLLSGGIVLVLELAMGWLVPFFFGAQFAAAVAVARIMLVAAFCFSMRRVIGDTLRGANKPLPASISAVVSWLVYGAAIVPLAQRWEARGAAVALALAAAASLAVISVSARRYARGMRGAHPRPPADATVAAVR